MNPFRAYKRAREAFRAFNSLRKSRKRRKLEESGVVIPPKEDKTVGKYSKAIAAIVGGVVGLVVARFPVLSFLDNPELIMVLTTTIAVYFAPKNAET